MQKLQMLETEIDGKLAYSLITEDGCTHVATWVCYDTLYSHKLAWTGKLRSYVNGWNACVDGFNAR